MFIRQIPTPTTAGLEHNLVQRVKKKGIKVQRGKPTLTLAIDVLIGDKEQMGNKKKETGSRPPIQLPCTFRSPINVKWLLRVVNCKKTGELL